MKITGIRTMLLRGPRPHSVGAKVEEVDLGWTSEALEAGLKYLDHIFGASLSRMLKKHRKDMTTYVRAFAENGRRSKSTDYVWTLDVANKIMRPWGRRLRNTAC